MRVIYPDDKSGCLTYARPTNTREMLCSREEAPSHAPVSYVLRVRCLVCDVVLRIFPQPLQLIISISRGCLSWLLSVLAMQL